MRGSSHRLARHDVNEIAWHARSLHAQLQSKSPVVKARVSPVGEGLQGGTAAYTALQNQQAEIEAKP